MPGADLPTALTRFLVALTLSLELSATLSWYYSDSLVSSGFRYTGLPV